MEWYSLYIANSYDLVYISDQNNASKNAEKACCTFWDRGSNRLTVRVAHHQNMPEDIGSFYLDMIKLFSMENL
jgi:hypothetical protein